MTPRIAGFAAAVVLIGLAAVAAWLVGVPLQVVGALVALGLVGSWRRAFRRARPAPSTTGAGGPTEPPATGR